MKRIGTQGFTLVELVVVMSIIIIITSFASLSTDLIRRERVAGVSKEIYADLLKTRLDAMTKGGKGFGIRLESENSYVLFKFNDCNDDYNYDASACDASGREETEVVKKTLNHGVILHKTDPFTSVNNDIRIFDRFGTPRHHTWGMGGITIIVTSQPDAGLVKCISVSANRIRESLWNGTECI
jgi:prepilin-type N-terminal cleavage/methylation domain-containing protein